MDSVDSGASSSDRQLAVGDSINDVGGAIGSGVLRRVGGQYSVRGDATFMGGGPPSEFMVGSARMPRRSCDDGVSMPREIASRTPRV